MNRVLTHEELVAENAQLHQKLREAESILRAIRQGQVDTLVGTGPDAERVYTRKGAERPFQILVEAMPEGAATLTSEGVILHCNQRFADMVGLGIDQLLGEPIDPFIAPADQPRFAAILKTAPDQSAREEITLLTGRQGQSIVQVSARGWTMEGKQAVSVIFADITLRKRSEEKLAYQAHLLANVHDAIFATDAQQQITFWNQAAERMYGWQASEVIGKHAHQVLRSEAGDSGAADLLHGAAENGRLHREIVRYHKDGRPIQVEEIAASLRDDRDQVIGYVSINRDLTDWKKAMAALSESELRYRLLFERNLAGVFRAVLDPETRQVLRFECNDAFARIFGYASASELLDQPLDQVFDSDEGWRVLGGELIENQDLSNYEIHLRRRDGSRVWVLLNVRVRENEERNAAQVEGTLVDISERKRAEEALRASEERFRLAVDNFPGVFVIYDADRRIRFMNIPGIMMSGLAAESVLGHTDEELFPPDVTGSYLPILRRAVETRTVQSAEFKVTLPAGAFAAKVTYVPLLDGPDALQQIVGIIEDITERKQAEEEIRKLNAVLEQRVIERTTELENANEKLKSEIADRMRAEEALRSSEARFRLLAENAQDLIFRIRVRPSIAYEYISPSATVMTGYTPEEFYANSNLGLELIHPEDRPLLEAVIHGEVQSDAPLTVRCVRKDGSVIWTEQRNVPSYDEAGRLIALEGIARDVTERKRSEEALQQAHQNLLNWAGELEQRNREISHLNEMGELLQSCLTVDEAFQVIGASGRQLFPDDTGALYLASSNKDFLEIVASWGTSGPQSLEHVFMSDHCWALRRGRVHAVEDGCTGLVCQHVKADHPEAKPCKGYICVPMVAQGETLGVLYLETNVEGQLTQSKQRLAISVAEHVALAISSLKLRETLRSQAIRDPLTGLFNRRYMEESLERELRRAARKDTPIGVVMLDLDFFKHFNDSYGHEAGDAILRAVGGFLQEHVREGDIACRYGGEEFTLILPEATLEETRARGNELREAFKLVIAEDGERSFGDLSISLGIAIFPIHGTTGEALLRAADAALYRAKTEGRDRVVVAATG